MNESVEYYKTYDNPKFSLLVIDKIALFIILYRNIVDLHRLLQIAKSSYESNSKC